MVKLSPSQLQPIADQTCAAMDRFAMPMVTPVYAIQADGELLLSGSGTLFKTSSKRVILTAAHVASQTRHYGAAHQLFGNNLIVPLCTPFVAAPTHSDFSIGEIIWDDKYSFPHSSRFSNYQDLEPYLNVEEGELFYFHGYPQSHSRLVFGEYAQGCFSIIRQELRLPNCRPNEFHLHYDISDTSSTSTEANSALPVPFGLSGALVWNTRRIEFLRQGKQWSPIRAKACGILRSWDQSTGTLVAVRMEHIVDGPLGDYLVRQN